MKQKTISTLSPTLQRLADDLIRGQRITSQQELLALVEEHPLEPLLDLCHLVTRALCGDGFDTCSIINVKSGRCSEDCSWCAQSGHFSTGCGIYDILETEVCLAQARHNEQQGVKRFSLVASGRKPSAKESAHYRAIFDTLRLHTGMDLCASLGLADEETLRTLYDAGVTTYHCNMESAPSYFPKLCTTHTQQDKEETLRAARRVGMRVCSGGIIGMGESREQRAEFALYLQSLGIQSIPLNVLQPIAGTPLGTVTPLSDDEFLRAVVLFRIANPTAYLRFAGGRSLLSREAQERALYAGVNAAITGDLLTTVASVTEEDMRLFSEMDYDVAKPTTWTER